MWVFRKLSTAKWVYFLAQYAPIGFLCHKDGINVCVLRHMKWVFGFGLKLAFKGISDIKERMLS